MTDNYQQLLLHSLKNGLNHFFEVCSESTSEAITGTPNLSASIYQLEAHVADLKRKHKVNTLLNPFIYSHSITQSFKLDDGDGAHRQADYQLPFLFFLFRHYRRNIDNPVQRTLHELIDDFIIANRDSLFHHDIVFTATGATRCKTNIRFALDHLRQLGLILSLDEDNDRCWAPSLFGILIVMFLHLSYRGTHEFDIPKGGVPGEIDRYPINVVFNPRMYYVVRQLHKLPEELILFLDMQDFGDFLVGDEKQLLNHFIYTYQSLVIDNMYLENPKQGKAGFGHVLRLKVNPRFNEHSRSFFRSLIRNQQFNSLYKLLLRYFSHPKFDKV